MLVMSEKVFCFFRGVDPNSNDKSLLTPLIIAAKTGRTHNIKVLMECMITESGEDGEEIQVKQVNINAKNKKKMTALHYAAKEGHMVGMQMYYTIKNTFAFFCLLCEKSLSVYNEPELLCENPSITE